MTCPNQDACGGCPAMDLSAEVQLTTKADRVARALGRAVDAVHASPRRLGYRARISLRPDAEGRLGYFRPRSHDHAPISTCAIARPELNAVLSRLPPLPGIEGIELRSDGERVVGTIRAGRRKRPVLPDLSELHAAGLAGLAVDGRTLMGDPSLQLTVQGIDHTLGPRTFYQVNLEINALLVERVGQEVLARQPEALLDLYSGAGNLSLPLAAAGLPLTLVEVEGPALADARATARRHGLTVRTHVQRAESWQAGQAAFDVAILDPPRAGAPKLLPELILTRPRAIIYVSCNPSTLARDLQAPLQAGYRLSRVEVFEMFPQTWHTEVLCVLDR